jgi:hypothetical protein
MLCRGDVLETRPQQSPCHVFYADTTRDRIAENTQAKMSPEADLVEAVEAEANHFVGPECVELYVRLRTVDTRQAGSRMRTCSDGIQQ